MMMNPDKHKKPIKPEVTNCGVFDVQVCVPENWSDERVQRFANAHYPAGTRTGWKVCGEDSRSLNGDPQRVPCAHVSRKGFVHILLEA